MTDSLSGQAAMTQTAPDPAELSDLVGSLVYKPGWHFTLQDTDRGQGCSGLTFTVYAKVPDSYNLSQRITVAHYFPVPAAAYNRRSWQRWLFDRLLQVEQHEAAEFFQVQSADGATTRPYAPLHGPGNDPYLIAELATDEERRTSFRGELNPESP